MAQNFDCKKPSTTTTYKVNQRESLQRAATKDGNHVLKDSWTAFSTKSKCFRWMTMATFLFLIISVFMPIWDRYPLTFMGDVNYVCQNPKVVHQWRIMAFRPKWFELFGGPAPITYKTKGRKGHRVSIVDIDRRDIEIEMWIDDMKFGHRPVKIDSSVDCGDEYMKCINMGFSNTMISVPPGKHVVKAEIRDVNGTFKWGEERQRRVWWMVEECS